jgi:ABC-type antimicrobial peptide transport system permease subunit
MASADFFPLTGVQAFIGRVFTGEDERKGRDNIALLDNGFWRREFAASPGVLGQSIHLDNRHFTIIGVLPPGLRFPTFGRREVWIPLTARRNVGGGGFGDTLVIGRLRPGLSRNAAQAQMDALTDQLRHDGLRYRVPAAVVRPLREWLAADVRGTMWMLSGAAGFLLLIGCANLANLLLARGTERRREMTIRAAMGAARGRLAVQLLTENLLLVFLGGSMGMALAFTAVRAVPAIQSHPTRG